MPEYPVHAHGLSKRFGEVTALDDVSMTITPGEFVGLLGPNGAGKTTLLNVVTGLRTPSAGQVRMFGQDPRRAGTRLVMGCTPQETGLPATLKVGEVVEFARRHYPDPHPAAELLERFGIGELARKQVGALSGGQKRRLTVALAFVGRPRLVLLDEPTTGLDVDARQALWRTLREYHDEGATIIATSHYLEEIEALAQRVVVMEGGRVLADDSLEAVVSRVAVRRVTLRAPSLPDVAGISHWEETDGAWVLYTSDADQLVRDLVRTGTDFCNLHVHSASLEEAFLAMTERKSGVSA